jgi:hypothetical protein
MSPDVKPELVRELRQMFLDGATPSRLMRRLLEDDAFKQSHGPALIDVYFSAAFGNKIYRMAIVDLYTIIQGLREWRSTENVEESWCDGLEATDVRVKEQEFDGKRDPYLAASWDQLDAKTQSYIRRQMAHAEVAHEKVWILQSLVERLQQKLFHLEEQLKAEHAGQ